MDDTSVGATDPKAKHWVLVGGGTTHLLALKRLSELKEMPFRVSFVSEYESTPLAAMLPDFIGGFYRAEQIRMSVGTVVEKSRAEFIHDSVTGFDFKSREILLKSGRRIGYDFVSINCGARPNTKTIKGAEQFANFTKPVRGYQQAILSFCDSLRSRRKVNLVQIGTDHQGLECCLGLIRRLKTYGVEPRVFVVEQGSRILPGTAKKAAAEMMKVLDAHKCEVLLETKVQEITATEVIVGNGEHLASDFTSISLPVETAPWLARQGLELYDNLIRVNGYFQTSRDGVFAVGDGAVDPERPWPRAYKPAIKQAKILVANMKAQALGQQLKKYRPAKTATTFLTDGNGKAAWSRGALSFSLTSFFWNWKARRDLGFLELFTRPAASGDSTKPSAP